MNTPNPLAASELVLNEDLSVYHLNLHPEELADTVLLVGDPGRVARISAYFDEIEVQKNKREFYTHTGRIGNKRLTVMSTGIGTENIDIVINELDALVNFNLAERSLQPNTQSLQLIRLGTCGSVSPEIPVDSLLLSEKGIGLDGLMNFYPDYTYSDDFIQKFKEEFPYLEILPMVYGSRCDEGLKNYFKEADFHVNTCTLPGFYGPQGRKLRANTLDPSFLEKLGSLGISNFEMETSALFALSTLLGHRALTINCVIANRRRGEFSADHHTSEKKLIEFVLQRVEHI